MPVRFLENPGELVVSPTEQSPSRSEERVSTLRDAPAPNTGKCFDGEIGNGYHFLLALIRISRHASAMLHCFEF